MPAFFFHASNATGAIEDPEGMDLLNLDAARHEAIRSIRSILCDEIRQGRCDLRGRIDIVDADETLLAQIRFDEAVEITLA